MDKTFQPANIETRWYQEWEDKGYFAPRGGDQAYSIMIPPPNVTGSLHMGHGFQEAIMDALIRYHRMAGYNTLWQVGTDHAGIATQMVVERQLEAQGTSRGNESGTCKGHERACLEYHGTKHVFGSYAVNMRHVFRARALNIKHDFKAYALKIN